MSGNQIKNKFVDLTQNRQALIHRQKQKFDSYHTKRSRALELISGLLILKIGGKSLNQLFGQIIVPLERDGIEEAVNENVLFAVTRYLEEDNMAKSVSGDKDDIK